MNPIITVDRQHLRYSEGGHELVLSVEWSAVAKTEDCPIDFEIDAGDLATWTKPVGEPIDPVRPIHAEGLSTKDTNRTKIRRMRSDSMPHSVPRLVR
ncbi:MAG: hypothetical protein ABI273_10070 [Lacunisphaera sp.]